MFVCTTDLMEIAALVEAPAGYSDKNNLKCQALTTTARFNIIISLFHKVLHVSVGLISKPITTVARPDCGMVQLQSILISSSPD